MAFEVPPEPIPGGEDQNPRQAGLIVVGEGFAGLCAAASARENGLDTLILTGSSGPWAGAAPFSPPTAR